MPLLSLTRLVWPSRLFTGSDQSAQPAPVGCEPTVRGHAMGCYWTLTLCQACQGGHTTSLSLRMRARAHAHRLLRTTVLSRPHFSLFKVHSAPHRSFQSWMVNTSHDSSRTDSICLAVLCQRPWLVLCTFNHCLGAMWRRSS